MSGVRNPFLKQNPYFIPQRFHSHQKINNYSNQINSSYFQMYDKPNNDQLYAFQQKRQNYNKDNNLCVTKVDDKYKKYNTLKRKNVNMIENPFYRKNLVPASKQIVQSIPYHNNLESKYCQLFQSAKKQQIEVDNYVKILSSKNILQEKENKPKYLSSELKIKLKSQTQINQIPISTQFIHYSPQKQGLVTLGRVQHLSSLRCNSISQKITVRGKTYFLQLVE